MHIHCALSVILMTSAAVPTFQILLVWALITVLHDQLWQSTAVGEWSHSLTHFFFLLLITIAEFRVNRGSCVGAKYMQKTQLKSPETFVLNLFELWCRHHFSQVRICEFWICRCADYERLSIKEHIDFIFCSKYSKHTNIYASNTSKGDHLPYAKTCILMLYLLLMFSSRAF